MANGCAGDVSATAQSLAGWQYKATSRTVGGVTEPLVVNDGDGNANLRLQFSDRFLGVWGCNSTAFDSWSVVGDILKTTELSQGWTLVGCPGGAADQDEWFAAFVGSQPAVTVDANDNLTLASGETRLSFVRERALDDD